MKKIVCYGDSNTFGYNPKDASRYDENIRWTSILHPNNVGRCGHISNASYAVKKDKRGQHIGELLVKNCIIKLKHF